jgi:hypothetical protein
LAIYNLCSTFSVLALSLVTVAQISVIATVTCFLSLPENTYCMRAYICEYTYCMSYEACNFLSQPICVSLA